MTWIGSFYRSALGKKAIMAATGLILFGWIFLHMVGNLKLYLGPVHMNEYGHWLRTIGTPAMPETGLLWVSRLVLAAAAILHIVAATQLTMMSKAARPIAYARRDNVKATYASRTMRWGGVIILLFVIYHLLHLTTGQVHHDFQKDNPFHNVVTGFSDPQRWYIPAIYILANLALGFHLYHGLWSMFASLGLTHDRFNAWKRLFATAFAVIITAGNLSFPIAVMTGLVH